MKYGSGLVSLRSDHGGGGGGMIELILRGGIRIIDLLVPLDLKGIILGT
jgi:hypothetical protein